jgi:hypothetical protein
MKRVRVVCLRQSCSWSGSCQRTNGQPLKTCAFQCAGSRLVMCTAVETRVNRERDSPIPKDKGTDCGQRERGRVRGQTTVIEHCTQFLILELQPLKLDLTHTQTQTQTHVSSQPYSGEPTKSPSTFTELPTRPTHDTSTPQERDLILLQLTSLFSQKRYLLLGCIVQICIAAMHIC